VVIVAVMLHRLQLAMLVNRKYTIEPSMNCPLIVKSTHGLTNETILVMLSPTANMLPKSIPKSRDSPAIKTRTVDIIQDPPC